ncbi:MAG: hypothetical protein U9R38_06365 [Candidatus Margulisiibacteriota bacterium]|nr:hypothetical protein [Candidatus Margulisiibacteriota bacterium]
MPKRILFSILVLTLLQITVLAKNITFHPVPNQPYLQSSQLMLDSEEYNTVVLKIKANKSGQANLFWLTSYDKGFDQRKNVQFLIKKGEKSYYLNIPSQNPNWIGWIKGLLLFPQINGKIEISSAEIIEGNLFTNIISGWQEFWGPRGRVETGSTINTMQSSNLYGRSVFVYIYWTLFFIFIGLITWKIIVTIKNNKNLDLLELLPEVGKKLVIAIIIIWALLEANTLSNNWNSTKQDFILIGKNINEKRTIINTGDFYPFIQFCKENIPADSTFDSRIPPFYNDIKATYYLYPIKHEKGGEFLVIYDKQFENELLKTYTPWKKFRNGAYILRKK